MPKCKAGRRRTRPRRRRLSARRSPPRRAAASRCTLPSFRRGRVAAPRRSQARRFPRATAPGRAQRQTAQRSRVAPEARGAASLRACRSSAATRVSSYQARSTSLPPRPPRTGSVGGERIGAYPSTLGAHARATLPPPSVHPARRRTHALARAAQPARPRRGESSSAPASSRSLLLFPFFTGSYSVLSMLAQD